MRVLRRAHAGSPSVPSSCQSRSNEPRRKGSVREAPAWLAGEGSRGSRARRHWGNFGKPGCACVWLCGGTDRQDRQAPPSRISLVWCREWD